MCPYAKYKKIDNYDKEIIFCNKIKDACPFTRYCNKLNKIIPNDSYRHTMEDCKMRKEIDIPIGSSRVRKSVSNEKYLYVDIEINGKLYTKKIKNNLKQIPDYVFVQEGLDGYEIIEKKVTNKKR